MNTSLPTRPKQVTKALVALFLVLAPFFFATIAIAQTEPPQTLADQLPVDPGIGNLSTGAQQTQNTVPNSAYADADGEVPLVYTAAANNTTGVIQNVTNTLLGTGELGYINDTYMGIKRFWGDDIIGNLFQNIGQLIGKWISEWINGWVADTVRFLTAFLRIFVLNPNIAVNGIQNGPGAGQTDDISPYVRAAADVMYGIAVDLLLLLFILAIWKYWAETAWRGGGGLMGAVGRLIFTAGLLLAWPTIYAFVIQITNEMIQAIAFNSADDVMRLDAALASAVKGGLMAGAGLLAHAFAPVVGGALQGLGLGLVGELVAFAGLVIYLILGGIIIAQLVYILVLKAIQTALLTAQYMFGPVFLVFFATPDTEKVATGYVRAFVETSLWTFVWVGLLKLMVIVMFSDFNPWGKVILAIGVLQLMIQVPTFLARAQISPMSDFITAGLLTGGLLKVGSALASKSGDLMDMFAKARGSWMDGGARGPQQTQTVKLNGLPHGAQDPTALDKIRKAAGMDPNAPKQPGKDDKKGPKGGGGQGVNPEQGKDVNGAKGTTEAAPPTKKNADDALNNNAGSEAAKKAATGATAAAAAAGIGATLAGAQTADANKQNTTTTPDPTATARDGTAAASMTGLETDAAADKQKQNNTATESQEEKDKKAIAAGNAVNSPDLNVSGALKSDKKDGTGTKDGTVTPEKKDGASSPDLKEIAAAALQTGDPAKTTKDEKNAAGLDTAGKNGPPLNVASTGSESTADKNVNKMEADQVNENLQAAKPGENETQVKINQVDTSGVAKNQDGAKLSFEPGDQKDQKRLQDTAAGLGNQPIVPPTSGTSAAAGARQSQSPDATTGKTLNPASTTAESQEPEPKLMGQMEDGVHVFDTGYKVDGQILRGVKDKEGNLHPIGSGPDGSRVVFSDSPGVYAQKAADKGRQVERKVDGKRPGSMARSSAPSASGAHFSLGESAATAADSGNPDMLTNHINESLQDTPGPTKFDPFTTLDHSNYATVDPHLMAKDIRTYAGPSMGKSPDGKPTIVGGIKGVAHVRFPDDASQEQKASLVAAAGYANSMTNDAEAFDAARQSAIDSGADQPRGFADRVAANWMQYRGGSWKETYRAKRQFQQAMFQEAVQGSMAYITGDEADSNAFTQHLQTRFGALGPEKQAWLLHTLTDNTSPESGFGTARMPATDALVQANMGIDPANRAAMGRVLGTQFPVWQRPIAAKGIANFLRGVVDQQFPTDSGYSLEERAAAVGGMAGKMSLAMVEACATIQQFDPTPETTLANADFVRTVAARGVRYRADDTSSNPMKQAYDEEINERKEPQHTRTSSSFTGGSTWGGSGSRGNTQYVDVPARPAEQAGDSQVSYEGGLGPIDLGPSVQDNISFRFNASPHSSASGHDLSSRLQNNSPLPQATTVSTNVQAGGSAAQTNSSAQSYEILYEAGDPRIADLDKFALQADHAAPPTMPSNVDIYVKMQQAGFTASQRRDPNVVAAAKEVYALSNGDSQLMSITAVAAHALGNNTAALDVQTVETVQTMLESGWRPNNISSHDIHIAQMIMDHNSNTGPDEPRLGIPNPKLVHEVATHPQFRAAPPIGRSMSYDQMHQRNMDVINQLARSRQAQATQSAQAQAAQA